MRNPQNPNSISPAAVIAALKINLIRRPLLQPETVMDCLDFSRSVLMEKIESGELAFAFDLATTTRNSEPRILSRCVVEYQFGADPVIGSMKTLGINAAIDLILPVRDIRSTELKSLICCGNAYLSTIKPFLVVVSEPEGSDGPNSFTVFSRSSVADFLVKRRMS